MKTEEQLGFAYIVENGHGEQFLLGSTFGRSRNKAKSNLGSINTTRCEQRRPMLMPIALCQVQISVIERIKEFG